MAITNRNTRVLHQRVPQLMNVTNAFTTNPGTGANIVSSDDGSAKEALAYSNYSSVATLYDFNSDAFISVTTNSAASSGAGSSAYRSPWSNTFTATGGSTTTIALSSTRIRGEATIGETVEFLTGANAGVRTTISDVIVDNASTTIVVPTLANAVANTDTFRMTTGRFFVMNGSSFTAMYSYDVASNSWSAALGAGGALSVSVGTDSRITGVYKPQESFASGTATAGTTNTLSNSAKSWTTNQWANYQVRITAGTGRGQIRVISSNTGTQLTVATNWTTTPDTTSQYVIEGDEDKLYLIVNGQTGLYRYSISANAWTTLSPATALTPPRATGMFLHYIGDAGDADWSNESVNRNGRYLWSNAGGQLSMSRYDIAANTWVNGITTLPATFAYSVPGAGSMSLVDGRYIYYNVSNTGIIHRFDAVSQSWVPYVNLSFIAANSNAGNRMFLKKLDSNPDIKWLYIMHGTNTLFRQLLY